jgi:xanthine dehydrogenase YagT iron-sulfur-binding subunit
MSQVPNHALQVGDFAPDCCLPDGLRLSDLRGQPIVLAFAPDEWNPAHAYQSEIFARLSQEFNGGAVYVDASTDEWRSLDSRGDIAAQFGVEGRRALFLIDERGMMRWKIEVDSGTSIPTGEVLAALESLRRKDEREGGLSRRAFLTATLAAAAVLTLPLSNASAQPSSPSPGQVAMGKPDYPNTYDQGGTIPVTLKINGKKRQLQLEPRVALLDALRENLHLTGTKKGCDHGQCGACTVHIDGQRALSCLTLAVMNQGKEITTIEGISKGETLHPVQEAFIKHDALQCGYCTPGQIMSAVALLKENRAHSDAEIREAMSGNLCRCSAYPNIIEAIKDARSA